MKGRISKVVAGVFTVVSDDGWICDCTARGVFRHKETDVCVGDIVDFQTGVIERIAPRKNFFVRPYIANIDQIVIIAAPTPPPDRMLIDKLLIKSNLESVRSLLVINKADIDKDNAFEKSVFEDYKGVADDIIVVSAAEKSNLKALKEALAGKLSALAGQSAVGKTSLLNALEEDLALATGGLSRIDRGRHTTRHSEIYPISDGGFIADTPGFSMYKLDGVDSSNLGLYYKDIFKFLPECRYNMCTHTKEPTEDCAVKRAAMSGKLSAGRYERYIKLFDELTAEEKRRY